MELSINIRENCVNKNKKFPNEEEQVTLCDFGRIVARDLNFNDQPLGAREQYASLRDPGDGGRPVQHPPGLLLVRRLIRRGHGHLGRREPRDVLQGRTVT
jgi:hypothetical protein